MKKETKERIKAELSKVESWLDAPASLIHNGTKKKKRRD